MRRSLTAVLAADIVGYSRMMSEDADATLATLRRLRAELLNPTIAARRGRVVKSMGDGWIVTFNAVSDAVQCAMQMQDRLKIDGEMQMRTGLHIGDIAEVDEDVFGDGVNIAARLQEIVEPGAVAISETVYHLLDGTLRPSFDDAGERVLKNIPNPVRVWVRGGEVAGQAATLRSGGFPDLIIRPIHTADPRADVQELATALTGDLASHLDAFRDCSARVSQAPQTEEYEIKGTLRAKGDRLRLEARLTAPGGTLVEAFKLDGDLQDVFDWQDDAAGQLAGRVLWAALRRELARIEATPEAERQADEWLLRGLASHDWLDVQDYRIALDCFDRAIQLQPENGFYYARALGALVSAIGLGYGDRIGAFTGRLQDWAAQLDRLEPQQSPARILLIWSQIVGDKSDTEKIRAEIRVLTRHLPFDPELLIYAAWVFLYLGEPTPALDCLARVHVGAHPLFTEANYLSQIGFAHLQLGQFDKALVALERAYDLAPNFSATLGFLVSLYGNLGREAEAKVFVDKLLKVLPDTPISKDLEQTGFVVTPNMQIYVDGLRKAGLPE